MSLDGTTAPDAVLTMCELFGASARVLETILPAALPRGGFLATVGEKS
jgi:hypothetical protein